ncbi:uncharacterized protein LOC104581440 [Brachypodium distachyon]|uniref:uncharacterized protein LOC104581440 n=1 Tax=Brachypodium distachyon TaxID=15368 RepID=UPI00052FED9D|nr:uncharacterized protein LOC104581440 [Brachypodium distachyon]|eukprot:XP_010227305.1 uncharacterized protein LOC104581440 [Brachypodium distachyon]
MEQPAAVSEVFGNGDLFDQILLRLDNPVFLVLASRVDKTWRRRATDRDFLGRFRNHLARRPRPRPLGFYVSFFSYENPFDCTKFVQMSQPPKLADVTSSAFFGNFGDNLDPGEQSHVVHCRNGRVLLNLYRRCDGPYAVLGPLDTAPAVARLPPLPPSPVVSDIGFRFLADHGRDGPLCLFICISSSTDMVRLPRLQDQDGQWVDSISCATGLSATLGDPGCQFLARDENLYMLSSNGYIVRLDLTSMSFLVMGLPDGVQLDGCDTEEAEDKQILSRAYDDFGVYFIQIKGLHLRVWVCKSDGDNAGTWMLEANISLPKAFGHLAKKPEDWRYGLLRLLSAGDNADFVFLVDGSEIYRHIFYLDIKTRSVEEVYCRLNEDRELLDSCHFMMT